MSKLRPARYDDDDDVIVIISVKKERSSQEPQDWATTPTTSFCFEETPAWASVIPDTFVVKPKGHEVDAYVGASVKINDSSSAQPMKRL